MGLASGVYGEGGGFEVVGRIIAVRLNGIPGKVVS